MTRIRDIMRAALWLLFLVAALVFPLIFFVRTPSPVGLGTFQVMGWGALVGIAVSVLAHLVFWPALAPGTKIEAVKRAFGAIALGTVGGVGGAPLLDEQRVVSARWIELPIARMEELPARRARHRTKVATLAPVSPPRTNYLTASDVAGLLFQGGCVQGLLEQGWLGGLWLRHLSAKPCSPRRGTPSTHVVVLGDDFTTWRWHQPRGYRLTAETRAFDDALPSDLICRTEQGSWLFRCSGN